MATPPLAGIFRIREMTGPYSPEEAAEDLENDASVPWVVSRLREAGHEQAARTVEGRMDDRGTDDTRATVALLLRQMAT